MNTTDNSFSVSIKLKARFLKPHLKRVPPSQIYSLGGWRCDAQGVYGYGATPRSAYAEWNSKTRPLEQRWIPPHQPIQWPSNGMPLEYSHIALFGAMQ